MFSLAAEVVFTLKLPYDSSTARICFCIQTWCLMQNMQNLWTLMGHDIVRPICICSLCVVLIKNVWAQAGLFPSRSRYNDTDSQHLDKTVFVQRLVHPGPVGAKELLTTPGSIHGCRWSEVGGSVLCYLDEGQDFHQVWEQHGLSAPWLIGTAGYGPALRESSVQKRNLAA